MVITTRLTVHPDGAISTATALPAGEHEAAITVHDRPARQLPTLHDLYDLPGGRKYLTGAEHTRFLLAADQGAARRARLLPHPGLDRLPPE